MNSPFFRKRLSDTLWTSAAEGERVYAILDGARDAQIFGAVDLSHQDKYCLYSADRFWPGEDLPWQLIAVAPYLVELDADDRLTQLVLQEGWIHHWGILLRSDSRIDRLRQHFRDLLIVQEEDSTRQLVFRYYDPRVLRRYLPTCSSAELRTLFGPVSSFLVPGDDVDTAIELRFEGNRLLTTSISLGKEAVCS